MNRDKNEWERIFREVGVPAAVAEAWGPAWADTVKEDTFSAGDRDLLDFVPTVLHESTMMQHLKESGYYTADRIRALGNASAPGTRWRSLVPRADEISSTPWKNNEAKFFEALYGGRMGNGPEGSGDGTLYAGAGLIQATGKANMQWLADRAGQDVTMVPLLLLQPHYSLELCIGWWEGRVPDSILGDDRKVRKVVNGGYFGLAEVEYLAGKVREVMS